MVRTKSRYNKFNKKELIDELERMQAEEAARLLDEESALRHDLQVHQIELEIQNRELREKQQELEAARDKYADLYDFAPVGYLTLDDKGVIREINLTAAEQLGKPRKQLVDKPLSAYLVNGDSKLFFNGLHKELDGEEEQEVEVQIRGKDDNILIMLLKMAPSSFNGEPAVRVAMLDIRERKQVEQALLAERDRAQRYLDTVEAIIIALDRQGSITLVNRKGCEILGYEEQELLGKNWFETCVPPSERDELIDRVFNRYMQGDLKTAEYYENPVLVKNGQQRLIAWHNNVLFDGNGNIIGGLSAGEDITERRRNEQKNHKLLEENRELTQHLFLVQEEERQTIARELHDEFGQWLTAIQLDAQNIANRLDSRTPEIESSVHSITDNAKRIHEGIRDIIHTLRPSLLDELGLADSLRELVDQYQNYNPDIRCQLTVKGDPGDLDKNISITIYRIVQEALTNIIKHARATQVEINLSCSTDKKTGRNRLLVVIEDDGVGIKKAALGKGMGIPGMRERVVSAGGSFALKSSRITGKQKGTRIEARFILDS